MVKHAKDCVPRGNAKITPQCQLQPSGYSMSLDRRDYWLGKLQPCRPHRPGTVFFDCCSASISHFTQIGSGAERSCSASQYSGAKIIVPFKFLKGIGQRACRGRINGIAYFRTIDCDSNNFAVTCDDD